MFWLLSLGWQWREEEAVGVCTGHAASGEPWATPAWPRVLKAGSRELTSPLSRGTEQLQWKN